MGATLVRSAGTLTIEGDVEIYDEEGEREDEDEDEEGDGPDSLPFEQKVRREGGEGGKREGGKEGESKEAQNRKGKHVSTSLPPSLSDRP